MTGYRPPIGGYNFWPLVNWNQPAAKRIYFLDVAIDPNYIVALRSQASGCHRTNMSEPNDTNLHRSIFLSRESLF